MKQLFYALVTTFLLFAVRSKGDCQPMPGNQKTIDSLTHQLEVGQFDTNRVKTLVHLARIYTTIKPALTLKYANRGLSLSKTLNYPYGSIISLQAIIFASAITGEWQIATESVYRGLEFCKNHYTVYTIGFYNLFALVQEKQNNNKKRLEWLLKAYHHPLFKYASPSMFQGITFYNLGEVYEILNKLDSAQYFVQKANVIAQQYNAIAIQGFTNRISGRIAAKKGNYSESLFHFHRALHLAHQMDNYLFEAENNLELAKTFHATNQADSAIYYATLALLETHFDPNLPLVSVIPQDIGRVLLNLINNAFYAVAERSRSTVHRGASIGVTLSHPDTMYQPTVTISTQKSGHQVVIKVQDNGNGIPEAIKDKIFQPFFTTKPTGQGTGLGLSLAYDIVTKGHTGTLEVVSTENEGSEFIVRLPSISS
jgi:tetratricopeptide (TPR) repeat protein